VFGSWYAALSKRGWVAPYWPVEYGGAGWSPAQRYIFESECSRAGAPRLLPFGIHMVGPVIIKFGSQQQKDFYLPRILSGEDYWCQGYSEPGSGSDLASLKTRAVRDGDHYVVNGAKTFITSGCRADIVTTAVRTGGEGHGGISLLVIERGTPGFTVSKKLHKTGWWATDTAELAFEDCCVPRENLIGEENQGFLAIMLNFAVERLFLAGQCVAIAELAYRKAVEYARERSAFGKTLMGHQVIRHKLADMATRIAAARALVGECAVRVVRGEQVPGLAAMTKNTATDMCSFVADQAVQIHGGNGYMREYLVERLYRDARLYPIGGGTREIMNEIISKTEGY
jgi:acyl-CoA dehydrogenase